MVSNEAEHGTCILMEVKTGEDKSDCQLRPPTRMLQLLGGYELMPYR